MRFHQQLRDATVESSLARMKTIQFDPNGGALSANVRSGFANPGAYTLMLWEKSSSAKAQPDRVGDFIDDTNDTHALAGSAADNDGRIVESIVTLSPPPGTTQYAVTLRILQDGALLDDVSFSGETQQPSVTVDLFARLAAR